MLDFTNFFYPKGIVFFGVSSSPGNLGRVIIDNLERFGFNGEIYIVNNRVKEIKGRRTYQDVSQIERTPDLAVFLIPAKAIPEILQTCGEKGIRNVIIESAGFSEFGTERKGLERQILEIASRWGITIIGPNCLGTMNIENGLVLPFLAFTPQEIKRGGFSFISQSGGIVQDLFTLCSCEGIGINKLVSIGNKLMVTENDLLEYLIKDLSTDVIGLYLEGFGDGRRFMELASSTNKPIIVIKSNIAPHSNEIARFHTSSLAGDHKVTEAALRQCGVVELTTFKEMVEYVKVLSLPQLTGKRLAFIARSGGHAVLCADTAYRYGFELAHLSEDFYRWLSERPRAGVIRATNPVDIGDIFDMTLYAEIAERLIKEPDLDGVVFAHSYPYDEDSVAMLAERAYMASIESGKPILFSVIAHKRDWFSLREMGYPVFEDYDRATRLLAISLKRKGAKDRGLILNIRPGEDRRHTGRQSTSNRGSRMIAPDEAFSFIQSSSLPVVRFEVADNMEDAIAAAKRIGYPVVLKTAIPDLLHKTEAGGVFLDIKDEAGLKGALKRIPGSRYLVQAMEEPGCEMIIGGREDGQFGKVILCGIGGVFVELYEDVSIRVTPINEAIARDMIDGLRGKAILYGYRGQEPYDVDALIETLIKVSNLLDNHPELKTIDINPLILRKKGSGAVIVDVKIEVFQ